MSDEKFLTIDEVVRRYRNEISEGTLGNWRVRKVGPPFVKIGRAVLYPIDELEAWDRRNMVVCDDGRVVGRRRIRAERHPAEPRTFA